MSDAIEDPRWTPPEIKALVAELPALLRIRAVCAAAGAFGQAALADGLLWLLAEMIRDESVPGSPEHKAACAALAIPQ